MTVYLDVVFLENFFMDFIILMTVGVCINCREKIWRILVSSCVGATFYILELFIYWITWFQFLLGAVMILISFGFHGVKRFFKLLCLFYLISLLFGGISFWIVNLINAGKLCIIDGAIIGKFNIAWIICGVVIGIMLAIIVLRRRYKHVVVDVVISVSGKEAKTKILLDTGNLLREPYQGKPVMIVEKSVVKDILDSQILNSFNDISTGNSLLQAGMFLIPYKSLGNSGRIFTRNKTRLCHN